jgi:hypothetical protein
MRAIHKAQKIIESGLDSKEGKTLQELVLALESGQPFALEKIYELEYKNFEIALAVLAQWRLDRHYASKFRLISAAVHAQSLQSP